MRRKIIGREADVANLREILIGGHSGVITPVQALTGGCGLGKTSLARHYSECHAVDYARRAFFRAETVDLLKRNLAQFADDLEGSSPAVPLDARADRELELIRQGTATENWLIILDNVVLPEFLGRWLPEGRNLHLLVTSRHPDWPSGTFSAYRAGLLSPEKSVDLLEQEAGRSDPDMGKLAEEVGYLPLALV